MGNFGISIPQRLNQSIARYEQATDSLLQSARVMLPAIVQSFDPESMTVSIQIATKEYVLINSNNTGISLQTLQTRLPLLQDVPVLIPRGGGFSFTFPIAAGDECMAVFADTAIDAWFQNGGTDNSPLSQRRHDLSDAIAVFGLCSLQNTLDNYSTTSAQLRSDDGTVLIDLATSGITITAPKVTVNTTGDCDVTASGNVNVTGSQVVLGPSTTIDAHVFLAHTHNGVTAGSGISGPVA